MAGRVRARKRFGQHFLADRSVAERIAALARPNSDQALLEIGPGTGALTAPLIAAHGHVIGVEIDRDLISLLQERFDPRQLRIIEGDVLEVDLAAVLREEAATKLQVVGNLPYNITAPVLFRLLDQRQCLDRAVLTVQREVAQRLTCGPGSRDYGQITVLLGMYVSLSLAFSVEPRAFRPVPKVHSAVVVCEFHQEPRCAVADERVFRRVVRTAFGQRRKMLRNSLQGMLTPESRQDLPDIAARAGIDLTLRPEALAVEQFAALSDQFSLHETAIVATAGEVGQ